MALLEGHLHVPRVGSDPRSRKQITDMYELIYKGRLDKQVCLIHNACLMKLFFEISTPGWAREQGVTDKGFAILQTATTFPDLNAQEAFIRGECHQDETAGVLNALHYAKDKGLI